MSRSEAQGLVVGLGAKHVSAISKNIDFVVAGENPGSKLDKAKKLKLNVIDETAFKKFINKSGK